MTTILICAGGTGGHVIPALSVAQELQQQHCQVHWLGTQRGIEARLVPPTGIPLHWMRVQGLRGKGLLSWLFAPYKVTVALWDAASALRQVKPNVVLGMGGFVAGPGGLMAKVFGIPLVIHEQNAKPGLTNRFLSRLANVVTAAFDSSFSARRAVVVGNPVRQSIRLLPRKTASAHARLNVLVFGGSQGAAILNRLMPDAMAKLPATDRPHIRHQCGRNRANGVTDSYKALGIDADACEFIDDMAAAYQWADLVIARAGALTVSELAVAGVPAILIPFPAAVDDHQTANALWLVRLGGALLLPEAELTIDRLAETIQNLIRIPSRLQALCGAASGQVPLNAQERLAELCLAQARGGP
jgi:UDP-N-acetylglucosamine--N-acetylmuramyl-(pentapeptide) pyrophosphoryl-undecaprenol N-acetylglucosamine transferase